MGFKRYREMFMREWRRKDSAAADKRHAKEHAKRTKAGIIPCSSATAVEEAVQALADRVKCYAEG